MNEDTYRHLDGHDRSRSVPEVAEPTADSDGADLGVQAVLLVHGRADILEKVLGRDGHVHARRDHERLAQAGRRLARRLKLGGGGGLGAVGSAVLLLDGALDDWANLRLDCGVRGDRLDDGRGDLDGRLG